LGVTTGGQIVYNPNVIIVTLSGTPAFTQFGLIQHGGLVLLANGTSFSGSATGARFLVESGGILASNNSSATPIPGNAAGIVRAGGIVYPEANLVSALSVGSLSGLGSTGAASVAGNSFAGRITLSPSGTGIAAYGSFALYLGFAPTDQTGSTINCTAGPTGYGTGPWNTGALVQPNSPSLTPCDVRLATKVDNPL
jgi:hypothetical protein